MSAANLSSSEAWERGVRLARAMLSAENLGELALESDCRGGRPQTNVAWSYLQEL